MKATLLACIGALALLSQSPFAPQTISVTLREGTNMAAALSPDGRTLIVDLQGSLWSLPAAGGAATRITSEYLDARQPAWSPDGTRVAFQGYEVGTWHIYVMNADGSGVRAVTSGPFDDREPSWSRDGARIAFRRIGPAITTCSISMSPAALCGNSPPIRPTTTAPSIRRSMHASRS